MLQFAILLLGLTASAIADTPANCTFGDIAGTWVFHEGPRGNNKSLNCDNFHIDSNAHNLTVTLSFPDVAVDQHGNQGHWTIIYNQGFEVTINYRRYFAFSNYTQMDKVVTSYCSETLPGWSHDLYVRDWACYIGRHAGGKSVNRYIDNSRTMDPASTPKFVHNPDFIHAINNNQKSWTAARYAHFEKMTTGQLHRMMGGPKSRVLGRPKPRKPTRDEVLRAGELPGSFDWRKVNGQNFVSPVRNQGGCGSCYAFGSLGALEARLKIASNNTENVVFSPQDVVECSEYSQGCAGGFPYLINGKYAEDFGTVLESANPYPNPIPHPDPPCKTSKAARRYYASDYGYIGGFYGGCNEEVMLEELVKNGPFAVGFEVYNDFMGYKNGVYHHTFLRDSVNDVNDGFNPFQITNHAVLIVGYGTDATTGEKFWTVKNSWGTGWGMDGYFNIRRGNDECGIESLGVRATPIPTY